MSWRYPAFAVIAGTCGLLIAGCERRGATVLGKLQNSEPVKIDEIRGSGEARDVTVHGVMIEKCPVAGCWFRLHDQTGTIKVDTKSAGFAVVNVPLQTEMTVSGKVVREGTEAALEATGVRY